ITTALIKEGLAVDNADEEAGTWVLFFQINGQRQPTLLLNARKDEGYLLAVSPITSPALKEKRIDDLSSEVLRLLIRVQGEVRLAKIECLESSDGAYWVAMSLCSVEDW